MEFANIQLLKSCPKHQHPAQADGANMCQPQYCRCQPYKLPAPTLNCRCQPLSCQCHGTSNIMLPVSCVHVLQVHIIHVEVHACILTSPKQPVSKKEPVSPPWLAYLIKALGSSPTRLVTLARGTFSHSPCNSLMKGKLTFLPYVYALIFRSQIIGNCQQGISIGMNSAMGNPLLSCSWFLAMAAFISLLAIIIWLLLFSLNETVLPSP